MPFYLLHFSDLHLDAPFPTLGPERGLPAGARTQNTGGLSC